MKKCKYCGADIEENARFCLYCMKSLEDKTEVVTAEKKKNFLPVIIPACLVLASLVFVLIFGQSKIGNTTESTEKLGKSDGENAILQENGKDVTLPEDIEKDKKEEKIQSEQKADTPEIPEKTDETDENDDVPTIVIPPEKTEEKEPEKTGTNAEFTYRKAESRDEWNLSLGVPANSVVITGVKTASSDGVYVIPKEIDGQKVVAVTANAFSGSEAAEKVKAAVIPSTVKTVWNYAFSACPNLKDIYLCANVYIEDSAFADVSKRNVKLTIHSSATCNDRNFREYSSYSQNYGADWKLWDDVSAYY